MSTSLSNVGGVRKEENVQNVKTGCVVQMSTDLPIKLVGCHGLVGLCHVFVAFYTHLHFIYR